MWDLTVGAKLSWQDVRNDGVVKPSILTSMDVIEENLEDRIQIRSGTLHNSILEVVVIYVHNHSVHTQSPKK